MAWLLVLEQLIFQTEAEARWLDHCESRLIRLSLMPAASTEAPTGDSADGPTAGRMPGWETEAILLGAADRAGWVELAGALIGWLDAGENARVPLWTSPTCGCPAQSSGAPQVQ